MNTLVKRTEDCTAEEWYARLRADAKGESQQKKLEILWQVLKEQKDRGSDDYSIALIARLTKARGGYAESSIRNEAGSKYRLLIEKFADEARAVDRRRGGGAVVTNGDWEDQLLARIDDVGLRAKVAILLSENRKLTNELNLLRNAIARDYVVLEKVAKQQIRSSMPARAAAEPAAASRPGQVEVYPPSAQLLPQEIRAIEHFLSEEHLGTQHWTVSQNGSIKAGSTTIAKVGFANALKKILSGAS